MIEAAEETKDGSYFVAQEKGLRTQKQWLAFYAQSQGSIWVDKGAAEASLPTWKESPFIWWLLMQKVPFSYGDIVNSI